MPRSKRQLFTLHRYFMTALWMRRRFYGFVKAHPDFKGLEDDAFPEYFAYMSLWYASLWVVIDGWSQMGIESPVVDKITSDKRYAKLKDFRDATMHFRPGYIDKKHQGFIGEKDSVEWVNQAHNAIGQVILDALNARGET